MIAALAFIISTQTLGKMNGLPLERHNEEEALFEEAFRLVIIT